MLVKTMDASEPDPPDDVAQYILDGVSDVVGPVLNDEGRQIDEEFDW